MWNLRWRSRNDCVGRLMTKILITTIQVNLVPTPNGGGKHKFTWIVVIKTFANNLPSKPFLGCHLGFHIFFHPGLLGGCTLFFLQLGCFGLYICQESRTHYHVSWHKYHSITCTSANCNRYTSVSSFVDKPLQHTLSRSVCTNNTTMVLHIHFSCYHDRHLPYNLEFQVQYLTNHYQMHESMYQKSATKLVQSN